MKRLIRSVLRRRGLDLVPRSGPEANPSMERAFSWLKAQDIPVRTVLDVGASDGRWSRECMQVWPNASYVMLEPNPVHFPGIRALIEERGTATHHVAAAASDTDGEAPFDLADAFGGALLEKADGPVVATVSLDTIVKDLGVGGPYLIKLDTHGFEAGILRGATRTLEDSSVLVIEAYAFHLTSQGMYFWELCAQLFERGFRPADLVDVVHREHDGCLWQMDIVFLRSDWNGFSHGSYR